MKKSIVLAILLCFAVTQIAEASSIDVSRHGSRNQPSVALTFDDCYGANAGKQIRTILHDYGVHATLFCTAQAVQKNADLMRGFLADGNEFGNHSISHPNLKKLSADQIRYQVCEGKSRIESVLNAQTTNLLRPPYGRYNQTVLDVASSCGYRHVVLWDVDTRDWSGIPAGQIVTRALAGKNGSIVIMHIGPANTPKALPRIIRGYESRGFQLVTVTTLLGN